MVIHINNPFTFYEKIHGTHYREIEKQAELVKLQLINKQNQENQENNHLQDYEDKTKENFTAHELENKT